MKILKKSCFIFFLVMAVYPFMIDCLLQMWSSKTNDKDILKTITSSSHRFGQLAEDCE